MAWDHLSITKPHLVYIILGGFTSLFMLCSSVIKERMYIGEATVATICGLIFGPHAADLINPDTWGNKDEITLEFSRIVLVVQCFAVGVELPKFYMEKHWKSVTMLLLPVMTFGWLITSLIIWWMVPVLSWLECLVVAACITATDPVLASSVVGKGKFAKRVPKHLRDLLSAESGCNDGMAFPFVYLGLYLIQENLEAKGTTFHWIVVTILYECVFGAIYGFIIGYIARHSIKYAERHDLIDRESFLVFYFVLALFAAGSGSLLGVDDLLVGFATGVGFSNDGWFAEKTEESHVSNVIDLLLNLTYFVYFGTIIPWEQFNNADLGLQAWRLVVIAIFIIFFRRIPVMLLFKPFIPDIKTWREALFAGHFGPIGVGAIFVAILARAELETEHTIPLAELPPPDSPHYHLIALVWPIVTFIVVASIIVHGSSVAVFTLGKRINTLSLTMSYTAAPEDGPSWMNRLPRISSQSRSQARSNMSDTDGDDLKMPAFPPGTLPPTGMPGQFLRRQREEDTGKPGSRSTSRRRSKKSYEDGMGPGGPVSQSAIFPQRRTQSGSFEPMSPTEPSSQPEQQDMSGTLAGDASSDDMREKEAQEKAEKTEAARHERDTDGENTRRNDRPAIEVYDEGGHIIIEDGDGQVLSVEPTQAGHPHLQELEHLKEKAQEETSKPNWTYESLKKRFGEWRDEEAQKRKAKPSNQRKHEPARAYQFGNTIIVEDEDGEVVKKYDLPSQKPAKEHGEGGSDMVTAGLNYMRGFSKKPEKEKTDTAGPSGEKKNAAGAGATVDDTADDQKIRFTIGGAGRRMTKDDFLKEVQNMDAQQRQKVLQQSNASPAVKALAQKQAQAGGSARPSAPRKESSSSKSPVRKPDVAATREEKSAGRQEESGTASPQDAGRSSSDDAGSGKGVAASDTPETDAERRRRLAAFSTIRNDDETETPAERRRREAALGVGESGDEEADSDDDDTPRVPPTKQRGIRFADAPPRNR